jgi:D-sedoheptulose 7-phosphate isomerase
MKTEDAAAVVHSILAETIRLHEHVRRLDAGPIVDAAATIAGALREGRKVLAFGNGGSAADAQHVAAELVGRFERDRDGFAAIALSTDTSVLTSVANDYGFDQSFARQVAALGRPGDVALAITTSGRSGNVVAALQLAGERGLRTIAMTGHDGGPAGRMANVHVNVPSESTARVQEVHRTLLHAICAIVEQVVG